MAPRHPRRRPGRDGPGGRRGAPTDRPPLAPGARSRALRRGLTVRLAAVLLLAARPERGAGGANPGASTGADMIDPIILNRLAAAAAELRELLRAAGVYTASVTNRGTPLLLIQ